MITLDPTTRKRIERDPRDVLMAQSLLEAYVQATQKLFPGRWLGWRSDDPLSVAFAVMRETHVRNVGRPARLLETRTGRGEVCGLAHHLLELIEIDRHEQQRQAHVANRNRKTPVEALIEQATTLFHQFAAVMELIELKTEPGRWKDAHRDEHDARNAFNLAGEGARKKMRELWAFYVRVDDGRQPERMPAYQRNELAKAI